MLVLGCGSEGLGCGSRVCAGAPRTVEEAVHGGASRSAEADGRERGLPTTGSSSPSADASPPSCAPTTAAAGWLARVPFPLWGKGTIGVWVFLFCSFLFSSLLGECASANAVGTSSSSAAGCSPSAGAASASAASCFTSAGSASAAIEVGAKSPVAFSSSASGASSSAGWVSPSAGVISFSLDVGSFSAGSHSSSASGASSSAGWGSPSAGVISFSLDVGSSSAGSFFTSAGSASPSANWVSPSAGASSSAGGRALSAARRRTARR